MKSRITPSQARLSLFRQALLIWTSRADFKIGDAAGIKACATADFHRPSASKSLSGIVSALVLFLLTTSGFSQETQRQYLSGTDKDHTVPWQFYCTAGRQSGFWTNIAVPSCWEMQGFGTLSYFNDPTNRPPEQGKYEISFKAPSRWADQRVFLVFDGVMTDTEVVLNGEPIGPLHQGSFYQFRYEVTKAIHFDEPNTLRVLVSKHSANAGVNRAERSGDYWLFGGIFRPVYLEAFPKRFIERVAIDARADGEFSMDVFVKGADRDNLSVAAEIKDINGKSMGPAFSQGLSGDKVVLKHRVPSPRQWTAETPNLYRVEVRLQEEGKTVHRIEQGFGFRTMEVRDGDGLYVNGRRVILKGSDRHSFWPDSGRCLSETVHRLDINTIKDMNMNAVRMSHYPPDARFLELCDELGLYVLDELGGWQKSYDTEVGRKLVREMIIHDVNHPCILFWDNGNEGGWNKELDGDFAQWDPQHRRMLHPWALFSGVNAAHYRGYNEAKSICAGTNIYMPTEFLHGLYDGGAGAGLEDYWELMRSSPVIGGGFIWSLLDEGVHRTDLGKIDVAGNQAPDGIVGPYRQKEGSFFTIKELWSPIVIREKNLPENFHGTLTVENRFSFLDAKQCQFTWQLCQFRNPGESGHLKVLAHGNVQCPSIAPGSSGSIKLDLPANWGRAGALALTATDPTGREIWTWVWPVNPEATIRKAVSESAAHPISATQFGDRVTVKSGELEVGISAQNGRLLSVSRGSRHFSLTDGPRPAVGNAELISLEHGQLGSDYEITARFQGALESVRWLIRGDGWVQCDYTYTAEGSMNYMGVLFDYPESRVKHKRWLGEGPYRVWKNRLRGGTLNVWESDYNNTITGWSGWEYPEFKGCFANLRWLELTTDEGLITTVVNRGIPYTQLLVPEPPPKNLVMKTAVSLPACGLGFLDAIPPIGSKFSLPQDAGPQGHPTQAHGKYTGSVSFHFGPL